MNDVRCGTSDASQELLKYAERHIRDDRDAFDLLFGVVLEFGLPLSQTYKTENLYGFTLYRYDYSDDPGSHDFLNACFDKDVTEEALIEIAKRKPLYAIFRDECFKDGVAKMNMVEIFKRFADFGKDNGTKIKTL